jgi:hypothetical protein
MSNELSFRLSMAKRILFMAIGIFALLLILRMAGGFDSEETDWLFGLLTPLNTLYASAAIRFVLDTKKVNQNLGSLEEETRPQYKSVTSMLIYVHLGLVYLFLILTAFNQVTFEFAKYALATIETTFALYMGQVVADLFKKD